MSQDIGSAGSSAYVLSVATVRRAVTVLQSVPVHEAFIAYLHLRGRAAVSGQTTGLKAEWNRGEVHEWLDVPGGPPKKPHFRPLAIRSRSTDTYWINKNLSGSYAKSSLRSDLQGLLVAEDGSYQVPTDSGGEYDPIPVASAMQIDDKLIPMWALAAFLYRNNVFLGPAEPPEIDAINEVFQLEFMWTEREIEAIFDMSLPKLDGPAFDIWMNEEEYP